MITECWSPDINKSVLVGNCIADYAVNEAYSHRTQLLSQTSQELLSKDGILNTPDKSLAHEVQTKL